jgi:hypothetical protein
VSGDTLIIDDHLLLLVLLGNEPSSLRPNSATLSTTGLWYHRLCRALADDVVVGTMSRRLGNLNATQTSAAIGAVIELPPMIGLVSLRTVGWPMAQLLTSGVRLNLLSLEALATAVQLQATLCLADTDDNLPLRAAATQHAINVRTIST